MFVLNAHNLMSNVWYFVSVM